MKLIFNSIAKPKVITVLPYHSFSNFLDKLNHTLNYIFGASRNIAIILPLLLLSQFCTPTLPAYAQSPTLSPRQVVEYALTLEKLEADFYQRAISETKGGRLAGVPDMAKSILVSYGEDETQHVTDLSSVLVSMGGSPDSIVLPANPNYSAILGRDPFANPTDLLLAGQYVEDLGVAAYKGQVQNLLAAGESGKVVLAAALAIHSVEARHAAGIRFLRQMLLQADIRPWIRNSNEVIYVENRGDSPIPFSSEAFDGYATQEEVLALVGPILNPSTVSRSDVPMTKPAPVPALW
jgi:hypothetical protein